MCNDEFSLSFCYVKKNSTDENNNIEHSHRWTRNEKKKERKSLPLISQPKRCKMIKLNLSFICRVGSYNNSPFFMFVRTPRSCFRRCALIQSSQVSMRTMFLHDSIDILYMTEFHDYLEKSFRKNDPLEKWNMTWNGIWHA